jgi:hypothetical protein
VDTSFRKTSRVAKSLERGDDFKRSHHALARGSDRRR